MFPLCSRYLLAIFPPFSRYLRERGKNGEGEQGGRGEGEKNQLQ
jgi:hypothetical protein